MVNYQNGKVYKLVGNGLTYYGSTCEPTLARRLVKHRGYYNERLKGKDITIKSILCFENDSKPEIFLVENFPCNSKDELHARERFYIENNECINRNVPGRTKEEYRRATAEHISQYNKEYREKNIDALKEKDKKYYEENKEKIAEYKKQHREKTKEQISEYNKEYRKKNIERMKEREKKYREANKELIAEKKRLYREQNKEKIAEQSRHYRERKKKEQEEKEKKGDE